MKNITPLMPGLPQGSLQVLTPMAVTQACVIADCVRQFANAVTRSASDSLRFARRHLNTRALRISKPLERGLCTFVALLSLAAAEAQSPRPSMYRQPSDFVRLASTYLSNRAAARDFPFSGSVLVARHGQVLLRQAHGLADREHGIPNTLATRFRTGSAGKQFTAAAMLLLEQRGALRVTDPVAQYLHDWPKAWSTVTIHHLLSHTAGLPRLATQGLADVSGLSASGRKPFSAMSDLMKPGEELQPLDFEPGTKFAYSNVGYVSLAMIVERVSNRPFADFMRDEVFGPCGMQNTAVDDPGDLVPGRARGYSRSSSSAFRNALFVDPRYVAGAGGFYSTVEDLLRWNNVLDSDRLLAVPARRKLFTVVREAYAYGWFIGQTFGRETQWHRGNIPGFVSIIMRYPKEGLTLIVMSNTDRTPVLAIANELAAIAFGEPFEMPRDRVEIPIASVPIDRFLGSYQKSDEPGETFDLVRGEGGFLVKIPKYGASFAVFPAARDSFFARSLEFDLRFVPNAKGDAAEVLLRKDGVMTRWKRRSN